MWSKNFSTLSMIVTLAVCATECSAQGPGGPRGPGGKPSFDRLLEAFDANDNEALTEDEVPGRVWVRLSKADADGDGSVTRAEFDGYKPSGK